MLVRQEFADEAFKKCDFCQQEVLARLWKTKFCPICGKSKDEEPPPKLTEEQFREIFEGDSDLHNVHDDNAILGLLIIRKYFPGKTILTGAYHDVIHSVDVDELLEAGITEADAKELNRLNWMIQDDCLACFV